MSTRRGLAGAAARASSTARGHAFTGPKARRIPTSAIEREATRDRLRRFAGRRPKARG